jgi:hypothetical protein
LFASFLLGLAAAEQPTSAGHSTATGIRPDWVGSASFDDYSVYAAPHGDKCGRSVYLAGLLEGNTLSGSMWRCTDSELIAKCTHQPIYKIDFTATVSRSRPLRFVGPETGEITIDSQQLNVAFKMQHWDTTACKEVKVEPLSDLVLRDDQINPTPTPTPTPPPPPDRCDWAHGGLGRYLSCWGWEWGLLDFPEPNKDQ